jgi:folate-binding protein YgfZ
MQPPALAPAPDAPWLALGRDVVRVAGPDALTYLQSQVSQDLRTLAVGETAWAFLLQPTGRIEVLTRIVRETEEAFRLDTDAGYGEVMATRLQRFKIRVKADLDASTEPASDGAPTAEAARAARIEAGWPAMGAEIVPGETIPAETGITAVAVSFTKGCYPGQELVERMDSRGAAAPRLLQVVEVPPGTSAGELLRRGGVEIGTVTSVAGTRALAYVKRSALEG